MQSLLRLLMCLLCVQLIAVTPVWAAPDFKTLEIEEEEDVNMAQWEQIKDLDSITDDLGLKAVHQYAFQHLGTMIQEAPGHSTDMVFMRGKGDKEGKYLILSKRTDLKNLQAGSKYYASHFSPTPGLGIDHSRITRLSEKNGKEFLSKAIMSQSHTRESAVRLEGRLMEKYHNADVMAYPRFLADKHKSGNGWVGWVGWVFGRQSYKVYKELTDHADAVDRMIKNKTFPSVSKPSIPHKDNSVAPVKKDSSPVFSKPKDTMSPVERFISPEPAPSDVRRRLLEEDDTIRKKAS